ncbi:hypothetical protein [Sphingomonas aquatilis]|uniref:hypothetical protein n=1 Tax=Sphingomonas aquatilis TaxID=93063 RepID=UPI0023F79C90|nr:hypothetical protein [Sphingomonas aquatilis]MCI4652611.1 hypothetical protein [Sphingomonas aquatilis]
MTDEATLTTLLDDVYETVSRCLAEGGHSGIDLHRGWFEAVTDDAGYPDLVATVPIGRDLSLRIVARDRGCEDLATHADRFAAELVAALVNVEAAKWSLRRYAGSVRRAALAVIEESRSTGLELSLVGVTFKSTRAFHLTHSDWRVAADYILAEVLVEGLDDSLRPIVHKLIVEEADDVADEILSLHDDQREYQKARDVLRRQGASVRVDEITLRHLARYGLDQLEALRAVLVHGHVNLPVTKRDGSAGKLFLRNYSGLVMSHVIDDTDFVWMGDQLILEGASRPANLPALVGRPVSDVCPDDLYAGMTITAVSQPGARISLCLHQPVHLVDLDAGRVWEQKLAA